MANAIKISGKTPEGLAMYPKVNTRIDDFKNKKRYVIQLEIPNKKDEEELIAQIKKVYTDFQALPENKGKEWRAKGRERLGFKKNKETGKTLFTFWTYAFYTDKKTKEEVQKKVPINNKYGQRIDMTEIGNGSKIKICFEMGPYYEGEDGNGVSLYLKEIIVKELVEYGGGSSAFADEFEEYDGGSSDDSFPDDDDDFPDKVNI
jgi:hypothetical protein